jgi:multidrug efflux pump subunit AcrA (membrane-fusion protein)
MLLQSIPETSRLAAMNHACEIHDHWTRLLRDCQKSGAVTGAIAASELASMLLMMFRGMAIRPPGMKQSPIPLPSFEAIAGVLGLERGAMGPQTRRLGEARSPAKSRRKRLRRKAAMRPHVALVPKAPLAAARRARLSRFAWLVSAAALLAGCSSGGAQGADASSDKLAIEAPRTAAATEIEVPVTLSLDGTLLADEESRVTSVVPGRVMAVLVERGQVVKKGDPLVRLRDVDYRLQAQAAEAALEQARARLGVGETNDVPRPEDTPDVRAAAVDKDLAEKNLVRSEELAKRGVLSTQQLDEARSRTTAAKERYSAALNSSRGAAAQLSSAKVALDQARIATSEAVVRAPFDGEIAERMVSVGEYIGPQTALVTLVRTDPLRLELQVPQQHVSRVQQGQHVTVSLDAYRTRLSRAQSGT